METEVYRKHLDTFGQSLSTLDRLIFLAYKLDMDVDYLNKLYRLHNWFKAYYDLYELVLEARRKRELQESVYAML